MLTIERWNSQSSHIRLQESAGARDGPRIESTLATKSRLSMFLVVALLEILPLLAKPQSAASLDAPSTVGESAVSGELDLAYVRPPPRTTAKNYTFDAFGPYAFVGTALIAGLDQETNTPPEWKQGFAGYSKRFGSDFGIAVVGTTTRYGLAAVLREDTSYYQCPCSGMSARLRHAVVSALTARRGESGHRVFSIPALIAPYAGASAAVYGWYPHRFSAKDALRMGNYSLLESVGANIALEFIYSGPHSLLSRVRWNFIHSRPGPGPSQ
jgi:hypothetical protein